jgi:MFS family permease
MGGDEEDGGVSKTAIPLIAGAIVCAQVTMAIATIAGDKMTHAGIGRKPLLMAGLLTLPIRCALIIYWKDSGDTLLLSTQILDGLGGGFIGLVHPYIVADITFGTGRFNVLSKYNVCSIFSLQAKSASCKLPDQRLTLSALFQCTFQFFQWA